jgi:extracellular elastinolytic metalloproteinase
MVREIDVRSHLGVAATETRLEELRTAAAALSSELPGESRFVVETVDARSGLAVRVRSVGLQSAAGDLAPAAIDHVNAIKPAIGLSSVEPITFRSGPTVLRTSSGASAVHLQQTIAGIPVFQAIRTVLFDPAHSVTSTEGITVSPIPSVEAEPTLSADDAVVVAAAVLNEAPGSAPAAEDGATTSLVWFDADDGLRLGWEAVLGFPDGGFVYRVIVDAHTAEILYTQPITVAVVARANVSLPDPGTPPSMRTIPRPLSDYHGQPWPNVSPFPPADWVSADSTAGPYVGAHVPGKNPALATPDNGTMTFNPANPSDEYARQVTLFYLCNFMHDYLLLLGFHEGNFQAGGTDVPDPVDAIVFPGPVAGTASMFTPPQGQPTLNAGLGANNRHTALDASVIFHEYTHGLTSRLVGGPGNSATLDAIQSKGLSEGWSDYVACTLNNQLIMGAWAMNQAGGIRQRPYDENYPGHFGMLGRLASDKIGPLNYQVEAQIPPAPPGPPVHSIGEIWCSALIELNRQIGSVRAIQIVVDALKLTPANPTFLDARDAVLAALTHKATDEQWSDWDYEDQKLKAWRAFAKFGMGLFAQAGSAYGFGGVVADFTVPPYPATIYAITDATFNPVTNVTTPIGDLLWYRHDGRGLGSEAWTTLAGRVGHGWDYAHVFGGGNGVIYAVTNRGYRPDGSPTEGDLLWYRHDGWRDGDKTRWTSKRDEPVGTKWVFDHIFSGGDGIIYGIQPNGDMIWRRHDGWADGSKRWTDPVDEPVGTGWVFKEVFSGGNGVIYAVVELTEGANGPQGGQLMWYRHDGWRDGSNRWATNSSKVVMDRWGYQHTFAGKDGVIYAVTATGDLHWYRHDGWHDGSNDWATGSGTRVGHGWTFRDVFNG